MEQRQLGTDGPMVSAVCLGAWPLGGGMGVIPDDQAIATIHASIEAGATFIDTAEGYRTSESVLGKALRGKRQDVFLATKLTGDHSLEHMTAAIENSLVGLGTDYVDLYQLHGPQPQTPIKQTMEGLLELKESGKIRHIGVSNFTADQHREAAQYGQINSSQPRYNMLYRYPEADVLPASLDLGIGVIAHSPLAKGMLTGKYRPGVRFDAGDERSGKPEFKDDAFNRIMPIVEQLLGWAGDHGRSGGDLAVAWTLTHPSMSSCIVGAKTPEQAIQNAGSGDWTLSDSDMTELAEILGDSNLDA